MSCAVDQPNTAWDVLRHKIESLRDVLLEQGSIVRKRRSGRTYGYLRYYTNGPGGRKQRSLYVGDDGNVNRVEALLAEMRAPAAFWRETVQLADLACRITPPLLRRAHPARP
jgi:hypothetical protein